MANDHDVVIKKADKDSRVIWERNDYIQAAESQVQNELVYERVTFK